MNGGFRLSETDNDRVYQQVIEPAYFLGTEPVQEPVAIIVAGQPGAGKARVLDLYKRGFPDENVVIVNTDDLRAYHPHYKEITQADDRLSAERTHHDASEWNRKLLDRSRETKRNIILEGVFKDGRKLADIINVLKTAGYFVKFAAVAVHERFSLWGIHERYEKERDSRTHGRFVPIVYHDECYTRLLDAVDMVENAGKVNRIEIFNRDAVLLFQRDFPAPGTPRIAAREAVEQERARSLSEPEIARYEDGWQRVFDYMDRRNAPQDQRASAQRIADTHIRLLRTE